jgi:hypothetical protein
MSTLGLVVGIWQGGAAYLSKLGGKLAVDCSATKVELYNGSKVANIYMIISIFNRYSRYQQTSIVNPRSANSNRTQHHGDKKDRRKV